MKKKAVIMVCSECGEKIAEAVPGTMFDIIDKGWECPCGAYWLSSDGWSEIGNLLIPSKTKELK